MWACPPAARPLASASPGRERSRQYRSAPPRGARLLPVLLAVLAAWLLLVDLHLRFFFWPGKLVILLAVFAAARGAMRWLLRSGRGGFPRPGPRPRSLRRTPADGGRWRPGTGTLLLGPDRDPERDDQVTERRRAVPGARGRTARVIVGAPGRTARVFVASPGRTAASSPAQVISAGLAGLVNSSLIRPASGGGSPPVGRGARPRPACRAPAAAAPSPSSR